MTSPQPARRFLGRPDEAYPGFVPDEAAPADAGTRPRQRSRSAASRLWLIQALTGAFLIAFLGVHLVAQHFLAPVDCGTTRPSSRTSANRLRWWPRSGCSLP